MRILVVNDTGMPLALPGVVVRPHHVADFKSFAQDITRAMSDVGDLTLDIVNGLPAPPTAVKSTEWGWKLSLGPSWGIEIIVMQERPVEEPIPGE